MNLNTYTFGRSKKLVPIDGLLYYYPNPVVAFSLQQLTTFSNGYKIPVIKGRRVVDNILKDFTATQVVDGTLVAFSNGGDVSVDIWYDQSGKGKNAIQTTPNRQPRIVIEGALAKINGKPAIDFNTPNTPLMLYYFHTYSTPLTSYLVMKQDTPTGYVYIYGASIGQITSIAILGFNGGFVRNFLTGINQSLADSGKGNYSLYSIIQDTVNSGMKRNGNLIQSTNNAYGTSLIDLVNIGGAGIPAAQFQGKIQEIITYDKNLMESNIDISNEINGRYNIY